MKLLTRLALFLSSAAVGGAVHAQADVQTRLATQREAMAPLAMLDGHWRGPAWTLTPSGQRLGTFTQTERVGSFLDGSVKVIEGRGYRADGRIAFNALGVLSFNTVTGRYGIRTYAQGLERDQNVTLVPDGLVWSSTEAGGAVVRYTITIKGGTWHEIGERLVEGQPPSKFFEMQLERLGDSVWPAAGAVGPQ